jgi:hypothetical protein
MAQFLSDDWFAQVDKIRASIGEIPVPQMIKDLIINITVKDAPGGDRDIRLDGGNFERGHKDGAPTKLTVPYAVAKAMFVDGDQTAGMQAFMSGQIVVEGDMTRLMSMQAAGEPSAQAKQLQEQVKAMTTA